MAFLTDRDGKILCDRAGNFLYDRFGPPPLGGMNGNNLGMAGMMVGMPIALSFLVSLFLWW